MRNAQKITPVDFFFIFFPFFSHFIKTTKIIIKSRAAKRVTHISTHIHYERKRKTSPHECGEKITNRDHHEYEVRNAFAMPPIFSMGLWEEYLAANKPKNKIKTNRLATILIRIKYLLFTHQIIIFHQMKRQRQMIKMKENRPTNLQMIIS